MDYRFRLFLTGILSGLFFFLSFEYIHRVFRAKGYLKNRIIKTMWIIFLFGTFILAVWFKIYYFDSNSQLPINYVFNGYASASGWQAFRIMFEDEK